ncbi:Transducin family protein/WD-40 repeat family protein [Abeliophyllum distichum]|uniref:Transducin family protein/WD-40 repeat family protein n=1 Tax=Abeliophyllum distichum TaxID=126358 RepID=A0ABD1Q471_9LAMI
MRSSSVRPENSTDAAPSPSNFQLPQLMSPASGPAHHQNHKQSNVFHLLARREVSPRTKRCPKRFWGEASSPRCNSSGLKRESAKDARQELLSWVEAESLLHLAANYCPLLPPPRSTIAAAFSPDGRTLASTHGDHTVKIIDCQTGKCLKVLSGHRRTPWVVRFHPLYPEVLASGSLDHEVRLWDAKTAESIGSRDFYRPIASIAFHAQGEILAVASGHKLYMWHYNRRGEASSPTIILKTRRSLRAVHFHPHAAPFLLTAEVNDLNSSDPSMTLATSPGYLRYPPPTIYLADAHAAYRSNLGNELPIMSIPFLMWPSIGQGDGRLPTQQTGIDSSSGVSQQRVDSSASVRLLTYSTPSGQYELLLSPIESNSSPVREESQNNSVTAEIGNTVSQPVVDPMETDVQPEDRSNQYFPFGDPAYWELPFLQGWLIGQSQAGQRAMHAQDGGSTEGLSVYSEIGNPSSMVPPVIPNTVGNSRGAGRSGSRHRSSRSVTIPTTGSGNGAALNSIRHEQNSSQPFMNQVQSEVATSLASAELPCTVKLRIWSHDVKNPCAPLDTERCRLTIPHAVLCSEMGAHFSPCGRFLAVCVACILPNMEADPGFQGLVQHDVAGASTSPTRHPISAHQVMYELRTYSLEKATFGLVLASRAIRAAHCLTSIQFSPTSEHLLLAYGRRHSSLLKSVVIDGDTTVPIYTILEIYRVSDMELVRVLASAEDEVNVACFHPSAGGGLVYGTKEGKLRILRCDLSHSFNNEGSCFPDENMFELPTYALEG